MEEETEHSLGTVLRKYKLPKIFIGTLSSETGIETLFFSSMVTCFFANEILPFAIKKITPLKSLDQFRQK